MIKIERPIVCLDFEATGKEPFVDRIWEAGLIRCEPTGEEETLHLLIDPQYPIHPDVVEMTGRTNESLKGCPIFSDVAEEIKKLIDGCDLIGFNLRKFDIPLLHTEFERVGIEWLIDNIKIIDAGNIFKKKEERSLKAAVKFYCNREFAENHQAIHDARETLHVLHAQTERYEDLGKMTIGELAEFSQFENYADIAGKLAYDKEGQIIYTFGKSKDKRIIDDPGFGLWMLGKDFPNDTKRIIRKVLQEMDEKQSRLF